MPKIGWGSLPLGIKRHLVERLRNREIATNDLESLKRWIATDPEVPDGTLWKDFGTFKLAGEGKYPKTFLGQNQAAFGKQL